MWHAESFSLCVAYYNTLHPTLGDEIPNIFRACARPVSSCAEQVSCVLPVTRRMSQHASKPLCQCALTCVHFRCPDNQLLHGVPVVASPCSTLICCCKIEADSKAGLNTCCHACTACGPVPVPALGFSPDLSLGPFCTASL